MSIEDRTHQTVYAVITELFAEGKTSIRVGDVADVLRARNAPIPVWQLRALFTDLESQGAISCNAETSEWQLTENSPLQDAG